MRRRGWLVGTPAPLRAVRPRRLLRHLPRPARHRARPHVRAPPRAELRARRGLVLGLRTRHGVDRARVGPTDPPPARPARAGPAGTRPRRLAKPRPLRPTPPSPSRARAGIIGGCT